MLRSGEVRSCRPAEEDKTHWSYFKWKQTPPFSLRSCCGDVVDSCVWGLTFLRMNKHKHNTHWGLGCWCLCFFLTSCSIWYTRWFKVCAAGNCGKSYLPPQTHFPRTSGCRDPSSAPCRSCRDTERNLWTLSALLLLVIFNVKCCPLVAKAHRYN